MVKTSIGITLFIIFVVVYQFSGHTLRRGKDDITNQSLKWNPQENRKVGRPKYTKWKREL